MEPSISLQKLLFLTNLGPNFPMRHSSTVSRITVNDGEGYVVARLSLLMNTRKLVAANFSLM